MVLPPGEQHGVGGGLRTLTAFLVVVCPWNRRENLVQWLSMSLMKLYIHVLSLFGRAPGWHEVQSIFTSHHDR